ncbi:MAG: hypothetical protein CL398_09670 [Acidiferrobacteraceae bacterium]|nr:hypothetical protein [Acidiferrobacteraceae bacterium]
MNPLQFPKKSPDTYQPLSMEPIFEPQKHLALETPSSVWHLEELGYSGSTLQNLASPIAFTEPFRLLSQEGAAALLEVTRQLKEVACPASYVKTYTGNRNQVTVSGGVYQSKFLRDLCSSPEITMFLSEIADTALSPHSMPSQQLYINYQPENLEDHVDIWHADSIGFDYVLMASSPIELRGGEFQIFLGTVQQAAELLELTPRTLNLGSHIELPEERCISFQFPDAGYAIFQQGNLVVHRARRLSQPGERITVVPGYVSLDHTQADASDLSHIATYGEPSIALEILRHGAWLTTEKLTAFLEGLELNDDSEKQRRLLNDALLDAIRALEATKDQ